MKGLQKIHSQRKCSRGAFLPGIESDLQKIIWNFHFHVLLPGIEIQESDLQNIFRNFHFFFSSIEIHDCDLQNILWNFHFYFFLPGVEIQDSDL